MEFLQVLITGLGQGCLYGLIALGFVLIYKATEIVNFAQGDLLMLGATLFTVLGVLLNITVATSLCVAAPPPLHITRITPSGMDVPAGRQIVFQFDRPVVPMGRMARKNIGNSH